MEILSMSLVAHPEVDRRLDHPEPPWFLVGSVRSGTTLLRLMLDHLPELAFFSEFEFALDLLGEPEGWPAADAFHHYLRSHRIFLESGFRLEPTLGYAEQVRDFLEQKRGRDRKPLVGATVHVGFEKVLRLWPDARFIHIVRDPRDVGRSQVDLGWKGNMHHAVASWIEAEDAWERACRVVPGDRRVEVRFEELVRRPEENLRRICESLGITFDPAMMSYPDHSTYGPPDPAMIDQWRRKLAPRDVQLAEATVGPRLVGRGYEPSGLPPIRISRALERSLRLQDRLSRFQNRRRRYGTPLVLADLMISKLVDPAVGRLLAWEGRVRSRLFEIDRRFIK